MCQKISQKIESLSDADLLGVLVGPRHAVELLKDASGSLSQLLHEPMPVAYAQPRVASRLKAAAELVRRSLFEAMAHRDVLASPAAVRTYLRVLLAKRDHEVFVVLFLDVQNRVIASEEMFRGTLTQTSVYPREVVKRTLELNAAAVILAHNHPSGVAEPSRADEFLTQTLKASLALIDARVLDHFIVAGNGNTIVSFAERGLL
jgi:DNA repair protein RadC